MVGPAGARRNANFLQAIGSLRPSKAGKQLVHALITGASVKVKVGEKTLRV